MAGHSKFKKIQHRKGAQDAKRAKLFSRIVRDICKAAMSCSDPSANPRLRLALTQAKTANLPKDRIEKAIAGAATAAGLYEEALYEGFICGAAIIAEVVLDPAGKAASDVKGTFQKAGATLGERKSATFLFSQLAAVSYKADTCTWDQLAAEAIDAGAEDVQLAGGLYVCYAAPAGLGDIAARLEKAFGPAVAAEVVWKPKEAVKLDDPANEVKVENLVNALYELECVERVYTNLEQQQLIR